MKYNLAERKNLNNLKAYKVLQLQNFLGKQLI